jgi:hypothetical protein
MRSRRRVGSVHLASAGAKKEFRCGWEALNTAFEEIGTARPLS